MKYKLLSRSPMHTTNNSFKNLGADCQVRLLESCIGVTRIYKNIKFLTRKHRLVNIKCLSFQIEGMLAYSFNSQYLQKVGRLMTVCTITYAS